MKIEFDSIVKADASDTVSKILRTALEMFAVATPAAVRMRSIAAEAKVNLASMNYHFGSKENLYLELAKMIVEYQKSEYAPFFKRFKEIAKSKDKIEAKNLIKDVLSSRIRYESETNKYVRSMILILMREELCNTDAFNLFLRELFIPRGDMMSKLIEIGSSGKFKGDEAKIAAKMLLGQTHLFNSARIGVKLDMNWKIFGESQAAQVRGVCSKFVDKILD